MTNDKERSAWLWKAKGMREPGRAFWRDGSEEENGWLPAEAVVRGFAVKPN